ncbi:unnamed protein product [Nyctereutes procyonoides]|uniref:(raccoon dog) hypothetical protein n=1 Tax=Nyctereutes procyonoides TaxID=34880 RepID=A0A811Z3K2_NYCPR|nr:unnamed protein product [Nyctereutes procyonoides]
MVEEEVLKTALIHDGIACGIPHLCVLAYNYDEPMYVKLVEALCLWKIDREGKPCRDYGKESQVKDVIVEYFKSKK